MAKDTFFFKNAEIFFLKQSDQNDKKKVVHEYPNSSKIIVEDLGDKPTSFTVRAFVINENGEDEYNFVKSILNSAGSGVLQFPNQEPIEAECLGYSTDRDAGAIGIIYLNITFQQILEDEQAIEVISNSILELQGIKEGVDLVNDSLFLENYNLAVKSFENIQVLAQNGADFVDGIVKNVEDKISFVEGITDNTANFIDSAENNFKNFLPNLVQDGDSLLAGYKGIFDNLYENVENSKIVEILKPLFQSNKRKNYKNANQIVQDKYTDIAVLNNLYSTVATQDYATYEDSLIDRDVLENAYQSITTNRDYNIDSNTRNSINSLRVAFEQYMDNKSVSLPRIIELEATGEPLLAFVYNYYGNLDNYNTLKEINGIRDTSYLKGLYKVISSESV